jgi:uncharacterized protein (DUF4415 family)
MMFQKTDGHIRRPMRSQTKLGFLACLLCTYIVGTFYMADIAFHWDPTKDHLRAEGDQFGTGPLRPEVAQMRREYDFSKARRNPYASRLKQPVTIRLDAMALKYFKDLAAASGSPYQTLINLYLRDCAATRRKLDLQWKPARKGAA